MWIFGLIILGLFAVFAFKEFLKLMGYFVIFIIVLYLVISFCPILLIPALLWAAFGYLFK